MSSFLSTLASVLTDVPEITELPTDRLIALADDGMPLNHQVSQEVYLKLARLQTLKFLEAEKGRMLESNEMEPLVEDISLDHLRSMEKSLAVQEDTTHRVLMLEQLMVEVVREAIPSECERLDVEYILHLGKGILFRPIREQRLRD